MTDADRSAEPSASGVWLMTPLKRAPAAIILVAAALAFLVLWDAGLLWSIREAPIRPGSGP